MAEFEQTPAFSVSKQDMQQLIHVFSHDLRNPLVNMEALIRDMHLCCQEGCFSPSKQDDMDDNLAMMGDVVSRMNTLIHGINSVYHAMFDDISCENMDVLPLLEREIKRYGQKHGMPENVSISMQVSGTIWGDPLWVAKMFAVLIENALQSMQGEGCLSFEMKKRSGLDVLSIRDTGMGIGKSDLQYIFQPFFSLTGRQGMGLALVRAWMQAHGGKVWCESRQDVGSIFYIAFPIDAAQ